VNAATLEVVNRLQKSFSSLEEDARRAAQEVQSLKQKEEKREVSRDAFDESGPLVKISDLLVKRSDMLVKMSDPRIKLQVTPNVARIKKLTWALHYDCHYIYSYSADAVG
jgi:hypothetical protein